VDFITGTGCDLILIPTLDFVKEELGCKRCGRSAQGAFFVGVDGCQIDNPVATGLQQYRCGDGVHR